MDNRRIGSMWLGEEHEVSIEQDNDGKFINSEQEIKDWVHYLNNPWSGTSSYYEVTPTYGNKSNWTATKIVVVYDSIDAHICAVGLTPREAIIAVDNLLKELVEKYSEEETENEK